jgi:peptidoglycan hydrolase-like protein with peptidoglycan-binding domain
VSLLATLAFAGGQFGAAIAAPGAAASGAAASAAAAPTALPHGDVAPPVPLPANPDGLPSQGPTGGPVEALAGYQPQVSCAAEPMRGTAMLRALVLQSYGVGHDGGAIRSCASGGQSEHKEGRAWDWMVDMSDRRERRAAADFISWLTAEGTDGQPGLMARRLGVMYVIFNKKMWASYRGTWTDYSGGSPHTDHVHISLSWNGGRGLTSFWAGRVSATDLGPCTEFTGQPATVATRRLQVSPCPASATSPFSSKRPVLWLGNTGESVRLAQTLLEVSPSGTFGTATRSAVLEYQRRGDLPRTGSVDKPTWASLHPASRVRRAPQWTSSEAAAWGTEHGSPELARGAAGVAVYAVQSALGLQSTARTGYFGRRTAAAVVEYRRDNGLPAMSRVTAAVWHALSQ